MPQVQATSRNRDTVNDKYFDCLNLDNVLRQSEFDIIEQIEYFEKIEKAKLLG